MNQQYKKEYALRDEPFGYTFFDKKKIRHQLLTKRELTNLLKEKGLKLNDLEILCAKRGDYRSDILYGPIRIYYEITLACNLFCKYCYNNSGRPRKDELSTSEILKSLDLFKYHNVLNVRFTGGEPTRRKDWYEIFEHAKELGFAVSCNTNAAYFNPAINEKFAKLNLEQITVSLDGSKKNHEMNRGKDTFERTIKNIKTMHSLGVRLRINTLVNKYSANDVEEVIDIASKYADEINFFTIEFIGRGKGLVETDAIPIADHYKMSKRIQRIKSQYPHLNILHFAEVSKKTSVNIECGQKFNLKIGPPSGTTTLNVLSNGDYCRGGYTPYINNKLVFGNIKSDDLFDIWQKNRLLERMRDQGAKLIEFCNSCPKFITGKCQGPKYETELNRLLNPNTPNPTCIYGRGPSLLTISGADSDLNISRFQKK